MVVRATLPPVLSADELGELLNERPDVRLLDVRTPGEFESVHIHGAYNVPLDTLSEHGPEISANVTTPLVLICQSGRRAEQAEEVLRKAGMPNLHVLDGGMTAWLAAGKHVERGRSRLPLDRQVRIVTGAIAAVGGALAIAFDPQFAIISAAAGLGLVYAGATNTCPMAMTLAHLPYNRPVTCDVPSTVGALKAGAAPVGVGQPATARTAATGGSAS